MERQNDRGEAERRLPKGAPIEPPIEFDLAQDLGVILFGNAARDLGIADDVPGVFCDQEVWVADNLALDPVQGHGGAKGRPRCGGTRRRHRADDEGSYGGMEHTGFLGEAGEASQGPGSMTLRVCEADAALELQRHPALHLGTPDHFGEAGQEAGTNRERQHHLRARQQPVGMLDPGAVRAEIQHPHHGPSAGQRAGPVRERDASVATAFGGGRHVRAFHYRGGSHPGPIRREAGDHRETQEDYHLRRAVPSQKRWCGDPGHPNRNPSLVGLQRMGETALDVPQVRHHQALDIGDRDTMP